MGCEEDPKTVNVDRLPITLRSRDTGLFATTNELTLDSVKEVLRCTSNQPRTVTPGLTSTRQYDTEYVHEYNEDLNAALVFVGFCTPLSRCRVDHIRPPQLVSLSSFVIDAHSNLESDSIKRPEPYLRTILDRSAAPSSPHRGILPSSPRRSS